jgi:predicted secreted protein
MKECPMRNLLIASAVAALCAALPAAAQNDQAAQPSQQQRARSGSDAERKICVNERMSESRITRRICRTAQQWRDSNDTDVER